MRPNESSMSPFCLLLWVCHCQWKLSKRVLFILFNYLFIYLYKENHQLQSYKPEDRHEYDSKKKPTSNETSCPENVAQIMIEIIDKQLLMSNVIQFKVILLCQPYLLILFSFLSPCSHSFACCCLFCQKQQR